MKNLIIGFIVGYLVCTFVLQGSSGVGVIITHSFETIQSWFETTIVYIQNYQPKA